MTTGKTTPNFFILLGLNPDEYWDQAKFEQILREKRNEWARQGTGIGKKALTAKKNLELLPQILRVMNDPALRAAQAAAARTELASARKAALERFEKEVAYLNTKEYIEQAEREAFINAYIHLLPEHEIVRRITVRVGTPTLDTQQQTPPLESSIYKDIIDKLRSLHFSTLYELLGRPQTTSNEELCRAAEQLLSDMIRRQPKTVEVMAKMDLAGHARNIFKSKDMRERYNESIRLSSLNALLKELDEIVSRTVEKELYEGQIVIFLKAAREAGWEGEIALDHLKDHARQRKWFMHLPPTIDTQQRGVEQPPKDVKTLGRVGQQLGNYRLTRLLGEGGFAEVYLGEHIHLNTQAAIKVLLTNNYDYKDYLRNEAHTLARLKHPNIIRILEFGTEGTTSFLVMSYAPNGTLRQLHPKGTQLSLSVVIPYIISIASALQYIHNEKLIYRAVKAENMLLGENNEILLCDFGEAIALQDIEYKKVDIIGTPLYMAPEQFRGKLHPTSDQYALGVVVYEWICGEPPFTGGNFMQLAYQHSYELPPPLRNKVSTISPTVEQVVMKALAKDPKDRFESVQAFADALEQASRPPRITVNPNNLVGQQFGHYRLTHQLTRGGFSNIYLGEHIDLGIKVAIKVLLNSIDGMTFQSGVRRISRLTHPNIVRVTDSGIKDGIPFLVMDYAPKGSLHDRHSRRGATRLPLTAVVDYVRQVAVALQEVHDHNIVLGYIHPRRMLIGENDEILLSGLDIVFIDIAKEGYISTISPYTAPEQIRGTLLPASDQYALAAIVYEWLSEQPPLNLSGSALERISQLASTPPTPLRTLVPILPQEVENVVMKALAKDPKQRFASIEDFARALEEASMPKSELKMPDRVGQTFGDYRLIKLLGRGGFADVYLGQHALMGMYAAVKVLHAQLMGEYAERFRNEARTIANLRHPAIVRVLGFGVEGDTPFLVMDQAKETLRDRHPQGSVLPPKVILPYVKQVAGALQHAHNQKLIHRDIKPENMLIGPRNEVLLSDFGIATVVHQTSVKNTQSIAGTAIYMAPEQFRRRIHIACDQYSLGIVVYEWLCGQPPFTEGDFIQLGFQHNSDPPPSLRGKVPSLSPDIERVVMIALAKDPPQRFVSIQAFANALEQACK